MRFSDFQYLISKSKSDVTHPERRKGEGGGAYLRLSSLHCINQCISSEWSLLQQSHTWLVFFCVLRGHKNIVVLRIKIASSAVFEFAFCREQHQVAWAILNEESGKDKVGAGASRVGFVSQLAEKLTACRQKLCFREKKKKAPYLERRRSSQSLWRFCRSRICSIQTQFSVCLCMCVHACVCAYVYVLTYMPIVQVYLIIADLAVQYFQERNRTVYGHICSRGANGSEPQAVTYQDSTITCNT